MPKNKKAGKFNGKSKSSKYFAENEEARRKKNAYQKKYASSEQQKNYRVELNRANRKTDGYGDGKDLSHTKSGKLVKESPAKNRARNGKGGKSTKK